MSVHRKLMQARMAFHAVPIKKTGWNEFSKYAFFELADFLVPALHIFDEVGLCGVVSFTADIATLVITDLEDGSQITITSPMGSAQLKACHEVQNIGAVETYQRRYLWGTAIELVEHDVLDRGATPKDDVPVKKRSGVMADVMANTPPLPAEEQEYVRNLAIDVIGMFGEKPTAAIKALVFDRVELEQLDNDQKLFLWDLLPSNIRTALKTERGLRTGAI